MTGEYLTVWQSFAAGAGLVVGSLFYSLGGRSHKWLRRFVGSFILAATVNGLAVWRGVWSPWMIAVAPLLAFGFSLGYGGDRMWVKFTKRLKCAGAVLLSGLLMALVMGGNAWAVFPFHAGAAVLSVYLGLRNPIAAASEEFFVCMVLNIGLMAYVFI